MGEHRVDPATRRVRRVVIAVGVVFAAVVWNAAFDARVRLAEQRYLDLQSQHEKGRGPAVTIRQIMDPAIRHAAPAATLAASAPVAITILASLFVTRRGRRMPATVSTDR
jgi:hypothetical protein